VSASPQLQRQWQRCIGHSGFWSFVGRTTEGNVRLESRAENTGIDKTNPLDIKTKETRLFPKTIRNARTIRSAAPLSIMHFPIATASAITIPK
jgi:hypothetical protein